MLSSRLLTVFILLTLFTPLCVYATDGSVEPSPQRRKDSSRPLEVQEIKDGRQNLREQAQNQLQTLRSSVAQNHANRLERRFKFYFERLTNIITRFHTLKNKGTDVSTIQVKLDAAKTQLASAKSLGEQAVADFRAIDPAKFSEQKAQAQAARDQAMQARGAFLEVHKLLKDALKLLKTISKPALPAASSAVEQSL